MSMFRPKTKEEKKEFEVDKIYVAKTEIISSYNDGQGCGPRVVTQYYLVTRCDEDDSIRELFSGVKLEPLRNMQRYELRGLLRIFRRAWWRSLLHEMR